MYEEQTALLIGFKVQRHERRKWKTMDQIVSTRTNSEHFRSMYTCFSDDQTENAFEAQATSLDEPSLHITNTCIVIQ